MTTTSSPTSTDPKAGFFHSQFGTISGTFRRAATGKLWFYTGRTAYMVRELETGLWIELSRKAVVRLTVSRISVSR